MNRARKLSTISVLAIHLVYGLLVALPIPAVAIDFTGSYDDPNHPNCLRLISIPSDDGLAYVNGTDGNPGCPPDGSGLHWTLTGKIQGDTILVDVSPKGGPRDLKGVWEPGPAPGIRWPDGNVWKKKGAMEIHSIED